MLTKTKNIRNFFFKIQKKIRAYGPGEPTTKIWRNPNRSRDNRFHRRNLGFGACLVYGVLLIVKCSRSIWGHSLQFRFSTTFCLENGWMSGKMDPNLVLGCTYLLFVVLLTAKVFKVILGSRKWLIVERKGTKFCSLKGTYLVYAGYSWLKVQGPSEVIRHFRFPTVWIVSWKKKHDTN